MKQLRLKQTWLLNSQRNSFITTFVVRSFFELCAVYGYVGRLIFSLCVLKLCLCEFVYSLCVLCIMVDMSHCSHHSKITSCQTREAETAGVAWLLTGTVGSRMHSFHHYGDGGCCQGDGLPEPTIGQSHITTEAVNPPPTCSPTSHAPQL